MIVVIAGLLLCILVALGFCWLELRLIRASTDHMCKLANKVAMR